MISIFSYINAIGQLTVLDQDAFAQYEAIHNNASWYLSPRIEQTQQEARRLIADAEALTKNQSKNQSKYQSKSQQAFTDKSGTTTAYLLASMLPEVRVEDYTMPERIQILKEVYGIDMTMADGTLQLDQPLSQGDYINYLRQIDTFITQENFGLNVSSLIEAVEVEPIEFILGRDPRRVGHNLSTLFEDWDRVRALTEELRIGLSQGKSTNNTSIRYKQSVSMTKGDISQVPDASPTDDVYIPLSRLNGFGINMVQPDGKFNGQAPIMRGEFVTLMIEVHSTIPPVGFEDYLFDPYNAIYDDLRQALQTTEQDLQSAIEQVVSHTSTNP